MKEYDTFTKDSVDNKYKYDAQYFEKNYSRVKCDYGSKYAIRIKKNNEYLKSVILLSNGFSSLSNKDSIIIENSNMVIIVGKSIFCLGLPNLNFSWQIECDKSTCFGIYEVNDEFIIHGELFISKISKTGKLEWQFSGRDIFVTMDGSDRINITEEYIRVTDWENNIYYLNFNGQEI